MVKIHVFMRSGRTVVYDATASIEELRKFLAEADVYSVGGYLKLGQDIKLNGDHIEEIRLEEVQDEATN